MSASRRFEIYGKINRGQVSCPLYRGCPLFGGSVIRSRFYCRLKENLREEDSLSTRDNWPVPTVSFVQRFYCVRARKRASGAPRTHFRACKSSKFPGGVSPDPPHTIRFVGPHFLYLPWAPPNPLGGPAGICFSAIILQVQVAL